MTTPLPLAGGRGGHARIASLFFAAAFADFFAAFFAATGAFADTASLHCPRESLMVSTHRASKELV